MALKKSCFAAFMPVLALLIQHVLLHVEKLQTSSRNNWYVQAWHSLASQQTSTQQPTIKPNAGRRTCNPRWIHSAKKERQSTLEETGVLCTRTLFRCLWISRLPKISVAVLHPLHWWERLTGNSSEMLFPLPNQHAKISHFMWTSRSSLSQAKMVNILCQNVSKHRHWNIFNGHFRNIPTKYGLIWYSQYLHLLDPEGSPIDTLKHPRLSREMAIRRWPRRRNGAANSGSCEVSRRRDTSRAAWPTAGDVTETWPREHREPRAERNWRQRNSHHLGTWQSWHYFRGIRM